MLTENYMRILFCNFEYPPLGGGGGVINELIAEELAQRHEVSVLTSQGFDLPRESLKNGVQIYRVPCFFRNRLESSSFSSMLAYIPMGIQRGISLLKKTPYEIINTHFVLPTGPVGDILSKYGKIPNVLSVHGGDLYDPSKFISPHRHYILRLSVKCLLRSANVVVGQSTNTIDNLHKYYDSTIKPIQIPLGIKKPSNEAANRQEYHFDKEDILFVTLGRLVARKSTDQLISIIRNLKAKRAHLIIIGKGPEKEALRREVEKYQLKPRIHFMENVSDSEKFRILHMSDIFVSTSHHEGFGLIFLEAMASGLPIICYDHGGQTDFLKTGQTGSLIKLNDQQSFESACREFIEDADSRYRFGKENKKLVERFYIENCAKQYEELFHQVREHACYGRN